MVERQSYKLRKHPISARSRFKSGRGYQMDRKAIIIGIWIAGAVVLDLWLGDAIFAAGGEELIVIAGFAYLGVLVFVMGKVA